MDRFAQANDEVTRSRIVIFTPFSHIYEKGNKYAQGKDADVESRKKILFTDQRLESRFTYFENICLPSLDAQIDKDFILVLRCSDQLPEKWTRRLLGLVSKRSYVYCAFLSVYENPRDFEKKLIVEKLLPSDDDGEIVITARLDDDDGLANDYTAQLRNYLHPKFVGHGISFNNGYYLSCINKEGQKTFRLVEKRQANLAVGLAYVSNIIESGHYIFKLPKPAGHIKMDTVVPVITDSRSPMFLVNAHEFNDSGRLLKKEMIASDNISEQEVVRSLGPRFKKMNISQLPM